MKHKKKPYIENSYYLAGKSPCTVDENGVECEKVEEANDPMEKKKKVKNANGKDYVTKHNAKSFKQKSEMGSLPTENKTAIAESLAPLLKSKIKPAVSTQKEYVQRKLKSNDPSTFNVSFEFDRSEIKELGEKLGTKIGEDETSEIMKRVWAMSDALKKRFYATIKHIAKEVVENMPDKKNNDESSAKEESVINVPISEGLYTELSPLKNGRLHIGLTEKGKAFIKEHKLENEPINEALRHLFSDDLIHRKNAWSIVEAKDLGAENNAASFLAYNVKKQEGSIIPLVKESRIYAYAGYKVNSEITDLLTHGAIIMEGSGFGLQTNTTKVSDIDVNDYTYTDRDMDVKEILSSIGLEAESDRFKGLFVKQQEGKYVSIYGIESVVPYNNATAYQLV